MWTNILSLPDTNPMGSWGSHTLVLWWANASAIWAIVASLEVPDMLGYFTSIIQEEWLDPHDSNTMSLHKRLVVMDRLLWSSTDFPHAKVQEIFNGLPNEPARVEYMEWLVLRLSLTLQSLNDSLTNFIRWAWSGENREILIWRCDETAYKNRLDTQDLSKMLGVVVAWEQEWACPIEPYMRIIPFNYRNPPRIDTDSRLIGNIGNDGLYKWALKWKYDGARWIENRFLRISYWAYSSDRDKVFWKKVLTKWEEVIWDINNWEITISIYNSILGKIRALLFQLWDIWILFKSARENVSKNPPRINF